MKITICSSISFLDEINAVASSLRERGHEVAVPRSAEAGQTKAWWARLLASDPAEFARQKGGRMMGHFDKVAWADAILVTNYDKKGVFDIPETDSAEEIVGFHPTIIHDDLSKIT